MPNETVLQFEFDKFLLAVSDCAPPMPDSEEYETLRCAWMGGAAIALLNVVDANGVKGIRDELDTWVAENQARMVPR